MKQCLSRSQYALRYSWNSRLLWNAKIYYRIFTWTRHGPYPDLLTLFLKRPFMARFSEWPPPFRFSD